MWHLTWRQYTQVCILRPIVLRVRNFNSMTVVTRFAPSPTGYLHVGGARTALFCWLYAKKTKGRFILRIEDTDLERSTEASIDAIIDSMKWLDMTWDEGPYYQSKRMDRYRDVIDQLVQQRH